MTANLLPVSISPSPLDPCASCGLPLCSCLAAAAVNPCCRGCHRRSGSNRCSHSGARRVGRSPETPAAREAGYRVIRDISPRSFRSLVALSVGFGECLGPFPILFNVLWNPSRSHPIRVALRGSKTPDFTGFAYLRDLGITLIAADDPDSFTEETPTKTLIRQILGAVAQFEKASLVAKLRGARERKRARFGRCEGRKPLPEPARTMATELYAQGFSLREIASRLAAAGYTSPSGKPYGPQSGDGAETYGGMSVRQQRCEAPRP